jgi:hypothetical protein
LLFPVAIGITLIYEDCAVLASVTSQITLTIAVNVKPPHQTSALNRALPHRCVDYFPFPVDIAWKTNID